MPAPVTKNNNTALSAVKARFVRLPGNTTFGRFKDLESHIEQSDSAILVHYYRKQGGTEPYDGPYLLGCLDWRYGEKFIPNGPRIIDGEYENLWQSPPVTFSGAKVTANQVTPFIQFLERWFPRAEEFDYFLWWMAMTVRHQDKKIVATPLLRSDHGLGKGFYAETLLPGLMGRTSVALCSLKDVCGDFNEVIEGRTVLVIDEVYQKKSSTTNALKGPQGNATITLSRKHKPIVVIENYLNIIVTSNDHIPLMLERSDRRFWVPDFIKHKVDKNETAHFLNKVFKPWLMNGGFQKVRDYLETIDLSAHGEGDPAPSTPAKQEILGFATTDSIGELLQPIVEENKVIRVQDVKDLVSANSEYPVSDLKVANALLSLDCVQRRTTNQRFYITPKGREAGLSVDTAPKELERHVITPSRSF